MIHAWLLLTVGALPQSTLPRLPQSTLPPTKVKAAAPYVSPPGYHRHVTHDGRIIEHGDWNLNDPITPQGCRWFELAEVLRAASAYRSEIGTEARAILSTWEETLTETILVLRGPQLRK